MLLNTYLGIILVAVPYFAHGISIPSNLTVSDSKLWTLNNAQNNEDNEIYQLLKTYGEWCCWFATGQENCNKKQLAYWAYIPMRITNRNERMQFVANKFDPRNRDEDEQELMCNCIWQQQQCQPVPDNNPDYPFFSLGEGFPATHSEQTLLPIMAYYAAALRDEYGVESQFYMYSYNSPCSREPDWPPNQTSCMKNIFETTFLSMYFEGLHNYERYHQMNVGFYQWYIMERRFNEDLPTARNNFCIKVDSEQMDYFPREVDFADGLKFRKFWIQEDDQEYYDDLYGYAC